MAVRTCDAFKAREVQAEPLEAAIPFWFISINMDSPSMNSTRKLAVPGRRRVGWPLKVTWSMLESRP